MRVTLEKVTAVTRMASGNMRGQKARCFAMKNVHGLYSPSDTSLLAMANDPGNSHRNPQMTLKVLSVTNVKRRPLRSWTELYFGTSTVVTSATPFCFNNLSTIKTVEKYR